ncbi:class C sortase [Sedimentibacter sp. SX930]|nr:class C sortase [Sedimentibacter sp. SX930]
MIFLLGLGIFAYPAISNYIYQKTADTVNNDFDATVAQIDDSTIQENLNLAYAYNVFLSETTGNITLEDPYTQEEKEAGLAEYARMLEVNEQMGHVQIPKIGLDAPIYAGTSETVLQKGIGHMEGTSLPVGGESTHAVITGHRGLPSAELFTELDELEIGDKFYVEYIGGTLAYEVDQIKVVEPTDFSQITIEEGQDYLTLLTCTPYMVNSHRLLVRGYRIEYVEALQEKEIRENQLGGNYQELFFIAAAVLVVVLSLVGVKLYLSKK